jgi:radical SAM superfamily enzyme YgiQ (UPF0313 family)
MPINSHSNQVVLFGDSHPTQARPYGIYVLASFLRKNNVKTQTIWGWNYISYDIFVEFCQKFLNDSVKVVGISSTLLANLQNTNGSYNFFGCSKEETKKRFQLIKKLAPNAKIVVGGSQVMFGSVLSVSGAEFIDLFVKGQGEQVLLELVKSPNTKVKTESIVPPLVSDISYPFQDFATTPTIFDQTDCVLPNEALAVEFARGCIFKCSFCSYELNGKKSGDYIKSKKTLTEELLQNYYNHGTTHYYGTDDLINDSEEKVNMILEVSQSLPFKLQYSGYVRLDLIRRFPSMAKNLKDSGMFACYAGIETINDVSGKKVGKGLGLERTNEAIDICNAAWNGEMYCQGSFILGLPEHNKTSKDELLAWLNTDRVRKLIKIITVQPLYITPGLAFSDIDKNPEKFGYSVDDNVSKKLPSRYNIGHMNWKTDSYSFAQAVLDAQEVRQKFMSTRRYNWTNVFRMPYLLSLSDKKQEMMEVWLTDNSSTWNPESWNVYFNGIDQTYRSRYIELMRQL